MYRSCTRCGKIHDVNHKCKVNRKYKIKDSELHKLRNTTAWVYKAREMKERAGYLCEVCKADGVYTYEGLEVHHIEKLKDKPTKLLDDDNLITLCVFHHKMADNGILEASYLRKLVEIREKNNNNLI